MSDVQYLVDHSESPDSPPRRLLLQFEGIGHLAVVLLNEVYPELLLHTDAWESSKFSADGNLLVLKPDMPLNVGLSDVVCDEDLHSVSSYALITDGKRLVIPTVDKIESKDKWATLGIVITGKQYLTSKILRAQAMPKDAPTPFMVDKYGDSYNDSFYKEPRVIEQFPATVITAIEQILEVGRQQFALQNYAVAKNKFQKAFHYAHSYYPEKLNGADLDKMTSLKMTSLQNLALASLKTRDAESALESVAFILDMPEISQFPLQKAKALYRRGKAKLLQGDDVSALKDFKAAYEINPDSLISREMEACSAMAAERTKRLRSSLAGAFS